MLATALKDLAVELNAFIMTATQLSNEDEKGGFRDFRNIRGSRAIADVTDIACIRRRPTTEELQIVSGFEKRYNFSPNFVTDIFKNRRGRWTMVSIWQIVDLGTLRTYDLFVTTPDIKPVNEFQIVDFVENKSEELLKLEEYYNQGNIEIKMEEPRKIEYSEPMESLVSSVEETFVNKEKEKERLREMDFSDLI